MSTLRSALEFRFRPVADIRLASQSNAMRERAPAPFDISVSGADGPYSLHFRPTDEWDGVIDVVINGHKMTWPVLAVDREADGRLTLSGSTDGSRVVWNDEFWYVVQFGPGAPSVSYYGDQVCWRTDRAPDG